VMEYSIAASTSVGNARKSACLLDGNDIILTCPATETSAGDADAPSRYRLLDADDDINSDCNDVTDNIQGCVICIENRSKFTNHGILSFL
jgi:hypothetical protein